MKLTENWSYVIPYLVFIPVEQLSSEYAEVSTEIPLIRVTVQ